MLVDVHAHLDWSSFDKDLDQVISRCKNFAALISNGTNPKSNRKVLELSRKYTLIKPALGLHPNDVKDFSEEEINKEIEFIKEQKPFAIGEVGLDLYHDKNLEEQKIAFKKFIDLAKELDIPIIVHSRKAETEALDLLEESGIKKVIMHCFSGNATQTERADSLGYMFSIPPTIVKNKTFRKVAKKANIENILTETDAPFLSPYEDIKRNEPFFIKETIKKISEIKNIPKEELEKQIYENYKKMFKSQ